MATTVKCAMVRENLCSRRAGQRTLFARNTSDPSRLWTLVRVSLWGLPWTSLSSARKSAIRHLAGSNTVEVFDAVATGTDPAGMARCCGAAGIDVPGIASAARTRLRTVRPGDIPAYILRGADYVSEATWIVPRCLGGDLNICLRDSCRSLAT